MQRRDSRKPDSSFWTCKDSLRGAEEVLERLPGLKDLASVLSPFVLLGHVGIKRTIRWSSLKRNYGRDLHHCNTMSRKRRGQRVPLLESTHTIKQMEYTNVLYAEPLFSSLKKNLIPTQVGPPSMMQSVPMQYRLLTTILMECTG
ncbi:methionine-R-sulfoxide reductase B3 isoform X7 [Bombina bombina]|uniref:methionine-R-sulfoxide reductase B3 isoform X7 n=1 Tax=Bombina bombina TaxID=8345 RepID=UPI00235A9421|nr:methionine-R-sulfoxide reductase B3 isoform X7 [Bombina bombina]XP_053572829.1 methionine-R-sulfoxide reductase B3 isoform X7 [Bombina bombina]